MPGTLKKPKSGGSGKLLQSNVVLVIVSNIFGIFSPFKWQHQSRECAAGH